MYFPPRRKITAVEWIGLVLAFLLGAATFVVGALADAGIVNMDLAKLMLGAALILLVVGAFVVEWLSDRSPSRIAVSTILTGVISGWLLFGIISPWMVKAKKEQDGIGVQQQQPQSASPSIPRPLPSQTSMASPSPTPQRKKRSKATELERKKQEALRVLHSRNP
jgi:uncharacterized membrane protein YfcA